MGKIDLRELLYKSDSTILDVLDHKCATCSHYSMEYGDVNGEKQGAHCSHYGTTRFDESCNDYDRNYNKGEILDGLDRIKRKSYYIVTAVCNILGIPDENEYRSKMARVIEEYLIGTIDGEQLLTEYDVYGAEIAWLMEQESEMPSIGDYVKELAEKELKPEFDKMLASVKKGDLKRAILRYIVMVRKLMAKYDIAYEPIDSPYSKGLTEYSPVHNALLSLKRQPSNK